MYKFVHWVISSLPYPDEKQPKSDLLVVGEGPPLLRHSKRIQHLPGVSGQPAVHQPRHSALREDVRRWLRQHRRTEYHQGRDTVWKTPKKLATKKVFLGKDTTRILNNMVGFQKGKTQWTNDKFVECVIVVDYVNNRVKNFHSGPLLCLR